VPHLFAAGEAVGGANGANRLSGNAITEAFVFGRRAGIRAAVLAVNTPLPTPGPASVSTARRPDINAAGEIVRLQTLMNQDVGPLRTRAGLERALGHLGALAPACADLPPAAGGLDAAWLDLHDLRNMRLVAECVARSALQRTESRGAHQRDDFPEIDPAWRVHQKLRLAPEGLRLES
jgi:succinate dehydrogenase/fumarate reductase flavoprotein subunit